MHVEKCGQREFCSLVALGARICLNGPLARCMAGRAASVGRRGHFGIRASINFFDGRLGFSVAAFGDALHEDAT